jgi:uncharacterized membrane protein YphA (DoxX/SURF4 family)
MSSLSTLNSSLSVKLKSSFCTSTVRSIALLGLCAAYLQGGFTKAFNFEVALAEMVHFGLVPAAPLALAVIALEIGGSLLILTGFYRWVGALMLGGFTFFATFVANRFWEVPPSDRFATENSFFEHLGLVGGFLLVAWYDLRTGKPETSGAQD